jgi:hypothetical protein
VIYLHTIFVDSWKPIFQPATIPLDKIGSFLLYPMSQLMGRIATVNVSISLAVVTLLALNVFPQGHLIGGVNFDEFALKFIFKLSINIAFTSSLTSLFLYYLAKKSGK